MKYRAVIFDFDFTLADATPGIVCSGNYALRELGYPERSTEEIRQAVGMTLTETFRVLSGVSDEAAERRFADLFKDKADAVMTENTALFPDTVEVLLKLKYSGVKTAIVTNKLRYRIVDVMEKYHIAHLVDHIVGFEDVSTAKPSPEGLLRSIEHLAVDKTGVLYVGDSLIDANTAANAAVDFAAVTTGTHTRSDFAQTPHAAIIDNLSELYGYIE